MTLTKADRRVVKMALEAAMQHYGAIADPRGNYVATCQRRLAKLRRLQQKIASTDRTGDQK